MEHFPWSFWINSHIILNLKKSKKYNASKNSWIRELKLRINWSKKTWGQKVKLKIFNVKNFDHKESNKFLSYIFSFLFLSWNPCGKFWHICALLNLKSVVILWNFRVLALLQPKVDLKHLEIVILLFLVIFR